MYPAHIQRSINDIQQIREKLLRDFGGSFSRVCTHIAKIMLRNGYPVVAGMAFLKNITYNHYWNFFPNYFTPNGSRLYLDITASELNIYMDVDKQFPDILIWEDKDPVHSIIFKPSREIHDPSSIW